MIKDGPEVPGVFLILRLLLDEVAYLVPRDILLKSLRPYLNLELDTLGILL